MYNNYGYNPYNNYRQQPIQNQQQMQPMQSFQPLPEARPVLNGKQVESIEVAKTIDIPCDGSINYFAVANGSAIVTKQIQLDGTSKTVIYKPLTEEQKDIPKYITVDDLNKAIKEIDLSDIDDLKEKFSDLKDEIKELKKKKKDE